ncbi:MAG TPA: 4-hydroxy-tetrahydrodipicolinate synthase [Clostridiales bacterium]|nr:4-hydroxy-tetrahydrodipicolinate synthase [Clostridiales bacterium]
MVEIKGIITPIVTPMNEDESINEGELRNQVNRQIEAGVHGIFPFGTNGEGYILKEEEKEQVLSAVIEETKGRVPVYAGTGCIGTRDTIRQSLTARALGADVLSIITPSFASASQNELYEHYKAIAEAVDMPIVLYNIPARTGNVLTPDTVERLSHISSIAGVKDSSGNFDNMLQYIEKTRYRRDFAVLAGSDSLILWNLMAGGRGAVSGCANVYPKTLTAIYESFIAGNWEEAREKQDSIRSFRDCFRYGNPNTIVKAAVKLLGYPVGRCRAPFNYISEEGLYALEQVLEENKNKGMH